jgi:hypothetical protein
MNQQLQLLVEFIHNLNKIFIHYETFIVVTTAIITLSHCLFNR